jgi:hypothetical protein
LSIRRNYDRNCSYLPLKKINMLTSVIKNVSGKYLIEFGVGKIDKWCVYLTTPVKNRYAPFDADCFIVFQRLGYKHGHQKIYDDFVKIYNKTGKEIDEINLQLIEALSQWYAEDALEIEMWFIILYAGMIAEENKAHTKLGKRIKRLGVHQLLMEKLGPAAAANFSKGKDAQKVLSPLMESKGF